MLDPRLQEEFVNLLADCQSRVRAVIFAMVHNIDDVEDLYQQSCLVMWRKFDTYEKNTQFVKWACSIAYLEVMKHLSQQSIRARFSRKFVEDFVSWEKVQNSEAAEAGNLRTKALYVCMERLSEGDRHILRLRYWEHKTVIEIAALLGRTPQSVSNSLGRIREQLLECIERARVAETPT